LKELEDYIEFKDNKETKMNQTNTIEIKSFIKP